MTSKDAPYATMNDLPKFQEREKVASAPWEKDQRPAPNVRAEQQFYSSSQTAPFATSDNLPMPRDLESQASRNRRLELHPPSAEKERNKQKASTAPWDRDESHYSAKIRSENSSRIRQSPYATELNRK